MKRIVGLVGLYKRQHFEEKETGNKIVNKLAGMVEAMPVKQRTYELTSAPMLNKLAKRADKLARQGKRRDGAAGGSATSSRTSRNRSRSFERTTQETMDAFAMFKPFMIDNEYLYRSDNVRALMSVDQGKGKASAAVVSRKARLVRLLAQCSFSRHAEMGAADA